MSQQPPVRPDQAASKHATSTTKKPLKFNKNSPRNAEKYGLRADRFGLLPDEDPKEFARFCDDLFQVYDPRDQVEQYHVSDIIIAMWREIRADKLEAEALRLKPGSGMGDDPHLDEDFGAERDRSLDTSLRYRSQAQAELRRAIEMLDDYREAKRLAAAGDRAAEASGRRDRSSLDQTQAAKAGVTAAADNDMVVNGDANGFEGFNNLLGHLNIRF